MDPGSAAQHFALRSIRGTLRRCALKIFRVIPGREQSERTRNLEIPGLVLRTIPE